MSQENSLLEKLEGIRLRFEEVSEQITNPDVISDTKKYIKLNKEYKELERVVEARLRFKNTLDNIASAKAMLKDETDPEMKEMAKRSWMSWKGNCRRWKKKSNYC